MYSGNMNTAAVGCNVIHCYLLALYNQPSRLLTVTNDGMQFLTFILFFDFGGSIYSMSSEFSVDYYC